MIALRWVLGLILAVLTGGFIVLTIVASGFRKSFGASEINPLIQLLPIVAMLVLLVGLIAPANRTLMHVGAVCAIALIGFCVWLVVTDYSSVLWFALIYLAVWLHFYWRAVHPLPVP